MALTFAAATSLLASEPATSEFRRHFVLRNEQKAVLYEVTEIIRFNDDRDENQVLVHDEDHGDFIMSRVWDFKTQIVTHRIHDVANRAFVQLSYKTPFTSRTRVETLREGKSNARVTETPAVVRIETNGGEWEHIEGDANEATALRHLRHQLRGSLSPFLLEAIERMRGSLFDTPIGEVFHDQLARFLVYDRESESKITASEVDALPNCDFDKSFGFPCSDKQLDQINKAAKDGRSLTRY